MTLNEKEKQLGLQFKQDLELLQKSLGVLMYSYEQCRNFLNKLDLSPEEEEKIEALTARFSRTSDFFTQKIIKTLLILLKEDVLTFIDRAHFLEKIGAIESAQELIDVRSLRNEISHEYSADLSDLFKTVLQYTPSLKNLIESLQSYVQINFPLKDLLK